MKILKGVEERKAMQWFEKVAQLAIGSTCLRSRCASIIVKDGKNIGEGFNSPPQNKKSLRKCLDEYDIPFGFRHDRTCCIHAEQRAIQNGLREGNDIKGARLYFIRIDKDGNKLKSGGKLKCSICTRAMLDAGILEFATFCEDGIQIFNTEESYQLSYQYKTPKQ